MLGRTRALLSVLAGSFSLATLAVLPAGASSTTAPNFPAPANGSSQAVCSAAVAPGHVACLALRRTDAAATSAAPATPGNVTRITQSTTLGDNGAYDPTFLQSAYNAPSVTNGVGQTVAIVDAYDDPNAAADLTSYRSFFGLPACTTASGCFRKVNETGGASYPAGNTSWSQEISLDLDMVSAICPNCHILLVEASSTSIADLGRGVNEAVALGANVVSNSYGGPEYAGEATDNATYFSHPGVAVTVAAGDSGYGAEFPSTSNTVTSVGGTSLQQATNSGTRNATETVWSGSGSGCSVYMSKPAWQTDSGCSNRTSTDVSAVANPNTGVWVYDSYGSTNVWGIFGGTSVATPIIGSMYALADNSASTAQLNSLPYGDTSGLNDVTSGSNGTCSPAYLCTGEVGYDGPTGLGTPNGVGAFTNGTVTVTPTAPSAPVNLAATASSGVVNLSWSPPTSTGGSPLTDYKIYRGTSSGTETLLASVGLTLSYSDTAVSNGTPYYYKVSAVNGVGESLKSLEATATPTAATVPSAPRSLTAKGGITKAIALAWSAPASTGGANVTGYKVFRGTASGKETLYTTVACTTATCSYSDTGTKLGTTYYYEVAATNSVGTGPDSNQASARSL